MTHLNLNATTDKNGRLVHRWMRPAATRGDLDPRLQTPVSAAGAQEVHLSTDEVRELARHLHAGQVDKQGRDYFEFHLAPIAAELAPMGTKAEQAGWLHDAIEDIDGVDEQHLIDAGVDPEVAHAVLMVSRQSDENGKHETYSALIERASSEFLSCTVKLADNTRNIESNPDLAKIDPQKAHSMLTKRYLPARAKLMDSLHQMALAEYASLSEA